MNRLIPWWVDVLLAVVFAAGVGAVVVGFGRHQREAGRQEVRALWSAEKVEQQRAVIANQAAATAETQRRLDAMQRNIDETHAQLDRANADAGAARSAYDRLRQQQARYLAAVRPGSPASGPATSTGSPTTSVAVDLFADLFSESDEGAGILAAALDSARAAGLACERAYDALTQH